MYKAIFKSIGALLAGLVLGAVPSIGADLFDGQNGNYVYGKFQTNIQLFLKQHTDGKAKN